MPNQLIAGAALGIENFRCVYWTDARTAQAVPTIEIHKNGYAGHMRQAKQIPWQEAARIILKMGIFESAVADPVFNL